MKKVRDVRFVQVHDRAYIAHLTVGNGPADFVWHPQLVGAVPCSWPQRCPSACIRSSGGNRRQVHPGDYSWALDPDEMRGSLSWTKTVNSATTSDCTLEILQLLVTQ